MCDISTVLRHLETNSSNYYKTIFLIVLKHFSTTTIIINESIKLGRSFQKPKGRQVRQILLSRIKQQYNFKLAKSFLYPVNKVENMEKLADNLRCQVAVLPRNYLRIPLGVKNKELEIWSGVIESCDRKLAR